MAEYQKDKEEVQKFLDCVKKIISKGTNVQLNKLEFP